MKSILTYITSMTLLGWSAHAFTLDAISEATEACLSCHKLDSPSMYEQWGASKHFRANVGCYECHAANEDEPDAFEHFGEYVSTIVTPKDCGRCHEKETEEFSNSRHAHGGLIVGSIDNHLAEVVEGNAGFVTESFPHGNSAAAVVGCWQCHGSEIRLTEEKKPDPATWPNSGIGRLNPDGSKGACSACHTRHEFSAAQARQPENCGKCHMGPDHPHIEIYNESKHGVAYQANKDKMNLDNPKWVVGEDYHAAPTCATCHMSAAPELPVTHDVGSRISWNNRPAISIRPEVADAKLGLPGADMSWEDRRWNMQSVCAACHNPNFVDGFYQQYDAVIDLYHGKYAEPGLALYEAAQPLLRKPKFSNKIDFIWFELWHHEGRRARHGASMMGPDITHWHGTYDLAKNFYTEYIPELRDLADRYVHADDPDKKAAAEALHALIDETLEGKNHAWYLDKMDPDEKARRAKAAADFKAKYYHQAEE